MKPDHRRLWGYEDSASPSQGSPNLPTAWSCPRHGWLLGPHLRPSSLGPPADPQLVCRWAGLTSVAGTAHRQGLTTTRWALETEAGGQRCRTRSWVLPAWETHQSALPRLQRFVLVKTQWKTKRSTGDNHELPPFKPVGRVHNLSLHRGPGQGAGRGWGPGCSHPQLPHTPFPDGSSFPQPAAGFSPKTEAFLLSYSSLTPTSPQGLWGPGNTK